MFFAVADNRFTKRFFGGAFIFLAELLDDVFDLLEGVLLDGEEELLLLVHQHVVLPTLRSNLAQVLQKRFFVRLQK